MKLSKILLPILMSVALCSCTVKEPSSVPTSDPSSTSESESSDSSGEGDSSSTENQEVENKTYTSYSGRFAQGDNTFVSASDNSLCVCDNDVFVEGTLSVDITPRGAADDGIVFGLSFPHSATSFWEGDGVSYYFLFLSFRGTLYLGKTSDGLWEVCQEKQITGFSKNNTYNVSVSFDRSEPYYDSIVCFVNGAEYFTFVDEAKLTGNLFGMRAGNTGCTYSPMMRYSHKHTVQPDIVKDYTVANGKFKFEDGLYVSDENNSIAVRNNSSFGLGDISCQITLSNKTGDNGIVFGLTPNKSGLFWELGVEYYFFFINRNGVAALGRNSVTGWENVSIADKVDGYRLGGTYTFKVERSLEEIRCYIDGKLYCTFVDDILLAGSAYGVRCGVSGVKFTDFSVNNTGTIEFGEPENYDVISGKVASIGLTMVKTLEQNCLILRNDISLSNGSASASIVTNGNLSTGFVFKSNNSVSSYYFLYIKGQYMYLDKTVDGETTNLGSCFATAGYSPYTSFKFKAIFNGANIKCLFNEKLLISVNDESPLTGNRIGIWAKNSGSMLSNISMTNDTTFETVETLVFGHSYMELWSTYAEDLDRYPSIANIGIGGSNAYQWLDLEDEIVDYNPKRGIYMIGINDLTGDMSPETIAANVKTLLLNIKARIPEFEVCLLSINKCPARDYLRPQIAATNTLFRQLTSEYDWIYYGNLDEAFTDFGREPIPTCFTDGLHPTRTSYYVIAQAIYDAFDGLE